MGVVVVVLGCGGMGGLISDTVQPVVMSLPVEVSHDRVVTSQSMVFGHSVADTLQEPCFMFACPLTSFRPSLEKNKEFPTREGTLNFILSDHEAHF